MSSTLGVVLRWELTLSNSEFVIFQIVTSIGMESDGLIENSATEFQRI